jgi:hypothetical protein
MFCASDNLLEDDDLRELAAIAHLLLQHGADPRPAMEIAEHRYGKYNPQAEGSFMEIWHVIASAMPKKG